MLLTTPADRAKLIDRVRPSKDASVTRAQALNAIARAVGLGPFHPIDAAEERKVLLDVSFKLLAPMWTHSDMDMQVLAAELEQVLPKDHSFGPFGPYDPNSDYCIARRILRDAGGWPGGAEPFVVIAHRLGMSTIAQGSKPTTDKTINLDPMNSQRVLTGRAALLGKSVPTAYDCDQMQIRADEYMAKEVIRGWCLRHGVEVTEKRLEDLWGELDMAITEHWSSVWQSLRRLGVDQVDDTWDMSRLSHVDAFRMLETVHGVLAAVPDAQIAVSAVIKRTFAEPRPRG